MMVKELETEEYSNLTKENKMSLVHLRSLFKDEQIEFDLDCILEEYANHEMTLDSKKYDYNSSLGSFLTGMIQTFSLIQNTRNGINNIWA